MNPPHALEMEIRYVTRFSSFLSWFVLYSFDNLICKLSYILLWCFLWLMIIPNPSFIFKKKKVIILFKAIDFDIILITWLYCSNCCLHLKKWWNYVICRFNVFRVVFEEIPGNPLFSPNDGFVGNISGILRRRASNEIHHPPMDFKCFKPDCSRLAADSTRSLHFTGSIKPILLTLALITSWGSTGKLTDSANEKN